MSDQQNNHEKNTESIDSNTEGASGSEASVASGGSVASEASVASGRSLKKRYRRSAKCCK